MKKLLSLLVLIGVLSIPSLALADVAPEPDAFTDVEWGDDYYSEISWLKDEGIVSGYSDGSFHPDETINRAEFSKIVAIAAYNFDASTAAWDGGDTPFTDIDETQWYEPYVHELYSQNIISGYNDNTFRPANEINFAEASKIVTIAYGWEEDLESDPWYQSYVDTLDSFQGTPDSIDSYDQLITRAEMAHIIYNVEAVVNR